MNGLIESSSIQDGRGQKNPYAPWERVLRLVWTCVYWLLFFPVPRFFKGWHRFILRCFGAQIGCGVTIHPTVRILMPWMLDIAEFVIIGEGVRLYSVGRITIGKHTSISQRVHVCAGTHDYVDSRMPLIRAPISIGAGCWICAEAFIGPGSTIGDRSVIGARSVVVKNVPPDIVCAGNPCRSIKPRIIKPLE